MKTIFKKNGGFTLVELIVVIAILAILAAVAIPAYSGYIEKANKAGDDQLVAAVNKAFFSACIENAIDPYSVTDASIQVSGKVIGNVTSVTVPTGNTAGIPASFAAYFAGNEGATFNVYESLVYNKDTHNFEGAAAIKAGLGGGFITMNAGDLNNLANSIFGQDIKGTLELVDEVSSMVAGFAGNTNALAAALGNPDFLNSVLLSMGKTPEEIAKMTPEEVQRAAMDQNTYLAEKMVAEGKAPDLGTAKNMVQGNALVVYAAQQTGKMDKNEMKEFLASANGDSVNTIVANMASADKSGEGIAQAALLCGIYTSYVKNDPTKNQTVDVTTVLAALEDPSFQNYLSDSSNYEKDLDGYVSSMNMVSSSAQDTKAVEHLMMNGFAGSGLEGIISDALIGN